MPPKRTHQEPTELTMAGLSKSKIVAHLQCPKRLWLQVNKPELQEVDSAQQARMDAGNVVGDLARQQYPEGVLIDGENLSQAIKDTAIIMAERKKQPVFEATFWQDGVLVRNDLLLPEKGGYHLVEVKSATQVKDYYLTDVALQTYVTEQAGVSLNRISVAHIDNTFVYPGNEDYSGLLKQVDVTKEARDQIKNVPGWIKSAQATLKGSEPDIAVGPQCSDPFDCPFIDYCHPAEDPDAFPVELLPHSHKLAPVLRSEGYSDIRDIPKGRLQTPKHLRVWKSTLSGKRILEKPVREAMAALTFPRYFLDFETISFAAPIWAGTRPYQQVPFQWSCHIQSRTGTLKHQEWLAEGRIDPRRGFVESLLAMIGPKGSILAYNASFERKRLEEMAEAFPEYAEALLGLVERIEDLLGITRDHYYHPDMRGSWSIKQVLPTIAPELSYKALNVGDGGMAQEAFLSILSPETTAENKARLRQDLLMYCQLDTYAMVEMARFFEGKRR